VLATLAACLHNVARCHLRLLPRGGGAAAAAAAAATAALSLRRSATGFYLRGMGLHSSTFQLNLSHL
jgi:hypothetical protein